MRALSCVAVFVASLIAVGAASKVAVPNTPDEAFVALDSLLSAQDRRSFMHKPERQAVLDAHFAVGMYIRNYWFRHGGSTLPGVLYRAGARSLDDMSSMVLTSYWRHLNHKPIRLKEQGSCYKRWWREADRLEKEAKAQGRTSWTTPAFECP